MVTKSFSFLLVGLTALSLSCAKAPVRSGGAGQPTRPQTSSGATQVPQMGQPQPLATPPPLPAPEQLQQPLSVGIYFGPGGVRSYAAIGILKAFQKAQIPVVAVGGFEWGALVAATYSQSQAANDVEWQMMKLKKEQLPSRSLIRGGIVPGNPKDLVPFLDQIFTNRSLEQGKIPFSCPTTDGQSSFFVTQGLAAQEILKCVSLPPLYEPYSLNNRNWMSAVVAAPNWGVIMRQQGVQFIVYVDVMSRGRIIDAPHRPEAYAQAFTTSLRTLSRTSQLQANYVIEVPMDIDMSDFDRRREAMAIGERTGNQHASEILKSVGY